MGLWPTIAKDQQDNLVEVRLDSRFGVALFGQYRYSKCNAVNESNLVAPLNATDWLQVLKFAIALYGQSPLVMVR